MREGVTQSRPLSVSLVSVLLSSIQHSFSVEGCFSDTLMFTYALKKCVQFSMRRACNQVITVERRTSNTDITMCVYALLWGALG